MAYITQEMKKELAPEIKKVLAKHGCKGSLSIQHHSKLTLTISEGPIDFIGEANERNKERSERMGLRHHEIEGYFQFGSRYVEPDMPSLKVINELVDAMRGDKWYDNSDMMTDYFDIAYYISINIGGWKKPYKLTN